MNNAYKNLENIFKLKDKIAVIIGGGGHLCSAMAEGLAIAGASLVIVDIRIDKAKKVANKLKDKFETNTL